MTEADLIEKFHEEFDLLLTKKSQPIDVMTLYKSVFGDNENYLANINFEIKRQIDNGLLEPANGAYFNLLSELPATTNFVIKTPKYDETHKPIIIDKSIKIGEGAKGIFNTGDNVKQEYIETNNAEKEYKKKLPFWKQSWFINTFYPLLIAAILWLSKYGYDKWLKSSQSTDTKQAPTTKKK